MEYILSNNTILISAIIW